jgi:hypothetical protein
VVLGEEHVPEAQFAGLGLEILDDLRVRVEAGDRVMAFFVDLLREHGVGGDAIFFDEAFDL